MKTQNILRVSFRDFLLVILAMSLPQPTTVLAQQSVQTGAHSTAVARVNKDDSICPFSIKVPEEALVDLRRRLAAARWSDQETVSDRSQGVQLATMKELVRYWRTDYDWRKAEAKLNALPQFTSSGALITRFRF